jgi:hypothetical protein
MTFPHYAVPPSSCYSISLRPKHSPHNSVYTIIIIIIIIIISTTTTTTTTATTTTTTAILSLSVLTPKHSA